MSLLPGCPIPAAEWPPVFVLLGARCPSAIIFGVRSIVVEPIKGVPWRRTRPHVLQKRLERLQPPIAHSDTTPTVVSVLPIGGTKAPLPHVLPAVVFRSARESVSPPECHVHKSTEASAASGAVAISRTEVRTTNHNHVAAIAAAVPHVGSSLDACVRLHRKHSDPESRNVAEITVPGHGVLRNVVTGYSTEWYAFGGRSQRE